jgi:hypothetical protein
MHSQMKMVRQGAQIALISRNGGRAMAWLLLLEVALLGIILAQLAAVLPRADSLLAPLLASLALVTWTAAQIRGDIRMTMDLVQREGRIEHISPIAGVHVSARFPLDDIEAVALQQTGVRTSPRARWNEYVVAVELRGGGRHILSARGPLLAYREEVVRFSRAAGLGSRVVRLPS